VLFFTAFLLVIYALVNVLGAWAVLRRKRWLAWLFMLAALALMLSAAALLSALPPARYLLIGGLVLASLAGYLNARLMVGRALPVNQLVRALIGLGLYGLVHWALG
jgi:hypothetical protein